MRRWPLIIGVFAFALSAHAEKFVASDMPGTGIKTPGRVTIRNDGKTIQAWQFHGDIRTTLVSLRSSRSLVYRPYGSVVYDSSAAFSTILNASIHQMIREAATRHGVDPRLVTAVARRESAFNPRAVSIAGAMGVMQLMPSTSKFLGVDDPYDAKQNILAGTRYLRILLDTFHGDLDLALAAYNAGPGAVERWGGVPPYRETINYVSNVKRTYEQSLRN